MVLRILIISGGIALLALSQPTRAEAQSAFPEVKSKRIKVTRSGLPKGGLVQISPEEHAAAPFAGRNSPALADTPKPNGKSPVKAKSALGRFSWFWEKISPDMTKSRPGRLQDAMRTLTASGQVSAPRLQALQEIAQARGVPILRSTIGTNVSPALVLAVIAVESGGRADAVSGAGAQGLMQLMPATASRFGVTDSLVAEDNIAGGVKYLDWLMGEFKNDPILALAGYNAGEGSVRTHKGVPPFAETRDYVPKVLAAFQVARGLCKTPPELITDGCVFATMN